MSEPLSILLDANNLDDPIKGNDDLVIDIDKNPSTQEKVLRRSRRGILESILRLQKRLHGTYKWIPYYFWQFRYGIFLCSSYKPQQERRSFLSTGLVPGIITRKTRHPEIMPFYVYNSNVRYYTAVAFNPGTSAYDCCKGSALLMSPFRGYEQVNLQYLNHLGYWDFIPAMIATQKERTSKNNRSLVFGEVVTSRSTEVCYTLVLPLEALYDQFAAPRSLQNDVLLTLLHSPVVYMCRGNNVASEWQRVAITTSDVTLTTEKQRAYLSLEVVAVNEVISV